MTDFFVGIEDKFNGITVDLSTQEKSLTLKKFKIVLTNSLEKWKKNHKRGIWIKIPPKNSEYISTLVSNGFTFHHTKPTYLMMTKWMGKGKSRIPRFCHAYLGAGGVVIDKKTSRILLISEIYSKTKWKIPGGMVDEGEKFEETAKREVFEETGIKTNQCEGILGFRHFQNLVFGCCDIYVICLLHNGELEIETKINRQKEEIHEAKWVKLADYYTFENMSLVQKQVRELVKEYMNGQIKTFRSTDVGVKHRTGIMYKSPKLN